MIHALPPQATSAVYSHIRGENRSEQAQKHAQQTFGDAIGKSFDDAVARFTFPVWMLQLLRKARDRIIRLLETLWVVCSDTLTPTGCVAGLMSILLFMKSSLKIR